MLHKTKALTNNMMRANPVLRFVNFLAAAFQCGFASSKYISASEISQAPL